MPKFTLDTNVVVDALRVPEQLRGLKAFLQRALPVTYLSAVVLQDLEVGVLSARQADLLEQQLVGPFERRGRVFAPTAERGVAAARGDDQGQGEAAERQMRVSPQCPMKRRSSKPVAINPYAMRANRVNRARLSLP